ncbi:MAG: SpoIIE family protein phosphatase, partial [Bacteroidia bacterium]|nr:SpoIIE family protein phosphatase [Bacteroidia bacterium]
LYYTQNGEVLSMKGTRRAIGGAGLFERKGAFETFSVELRKGDCLYMGTDGYWDQPNEKRRKFSRTHFMQYLDAIKYFPMAEQKEKLTKMLYEHMGHRNVQRDDITLLGIRL